MPPRPQPPVNFLGFARSDSPRGELLPRLADELRQVRQALDPAVRARKIDLVERTDATLDDILAVFHDDRYRGRIAIFHFAGHADGQSLLVEQYVGAVAFQAAVHGQAGLRLVVINACSTREQADGLHAAGAPAVIATSVPVHDDSAATFAMRFYRALAGGMTVADAFAVAAKAAAGDAYPLPAEMAGGWLLSTANSAAGEWTLPPAAEPDIIPLHKPQRVQHFTGRGQELTNLLAALRPGCRVTLCGPGGIGKSALAAEAIWAISPGSEPPALFPDGIVFHTFYHQPSAGLAHEAIARAFGVILHADPDPLPTLDVGVGPRIDPKTAARQVLAGRQALLVLDGAEAADDLDDVLEVVGGACGVLITSRRHSDARGSFRDLGPLKDADSLALLRAWAEGMAADAGAAGEVVDLLGGLPLAIFLAGRYLAQQGQLASEYAAWLREEGLAALHFGERPSRSIPLLLERSLATVSELAQSAFGVAGVLALEPFGRDVVAMGLGIEPPTATRALGELVNYGLLQRLDASYQVAHALAHAYARTRVPAPLEVLVRVAGHYIALANEQTARGLPGFVELDRQLGHILAVQAACLKAEQWTAVRQIERNMSNYLDLHGRWNEWTTLLANSLTAAQQSNDRSDEGRIFLLLSLAFLPLGDPHEAIKYSEQAVVIYRELGDRDSEGRALGGLGNASIFLNDMARAIDYYERALAIARKCGAIGVEGIALGGLGIAYAHLGEVHRAIEYHVQYLTIARARGDRRSIGIALGGLGLAYNNLGEARRAIEYHEQCLAIHREIGDRLGEAAALANLGAACGILSEVRRATECYEQALAIAREIGDLNSEDVVLGKLGSAYRNLGEMRRAMEYSEQHLVVARKTGNRQGEAIALGNLAIAYRTMGEVRRSIEHFEQVLAIDRELGNRKHEGATLGYLGLNYRDMGDIGRAVTYCEQARAIFLETGDTTGTEHMANLILAIRSSPMDVDQSQNIASRRPQSAYTGAQQAATAAKASGDYPAHAAALKQIRETARRAADSKTEVDALLQLAELTRATGDRNAEGEHLADLGSVYYAHAQYDDAISAYDQSIALARQVKDAKAEAYRSWHLGLVYEKLGEPRHAADMMQVRVDYERKVKHPSAEEHARRVQALRKQKPGSGGRRH